MFRRRRRPRSRLRRPAAQDVGRVRRALRRSPDGHRHGGPGRSASSPTYRLKRCVGRIRRPRRRADRRCIAAHCFRAGAVAQRSTATPPRPPRSRLPRRDSETRGPNAATASACLPCAMKISPVSSASSADSLTLPATSATTLAASSTFPTPSNIRASSWAAGRLPGSSPRTLHKSSVAWAVFPARASSSASINVTETGLPERSSAS